MRNVLWGLALFFRSGLKLVVPDVTHLVGNTAFWTSVGPAPSEAKDDGGGLVFCFDHSGVPRRYIAKVLSAHVQSASGMEEPFFVKLLFKKALGQ